MFVFTHWTHEYEGGFRELTLKNDYTPPSAEDKIGEAVVVEIMDDQTRTCLQFEFRPGEHGYELLVTFPTDWHVPNCRLTEMDLEDILTSAEERQMEAQQLQAEEQEARHEQAYLERLADAEKRG